MKQEKICLCLGCHIPLTEKLVRWIEDRHFCYYCFKRHTKKLNREGGKNETENFED